MHAEIGVRGAEDADRRPLALSLAAVAEERDGVAGEPPVDVDKRAENWPIERTLVAVADGEIIGSVSVHPIRFGCGEIGMHVARDWRRRGAGSALVAAAIEWAREQGLHKLSLEVWPHNAAALALYRNFGFEEEGRKVKQYRRVSGDLWDVIVMGLLL